MYTLKLPRADELIHLREWHQGREAFGLWYVTMPDELSMYCQNLRLRFDDIFVPNYERVFHITLFVVGFCGVDDFCKTDLDKQIGALQDLNLSPFELSLSSLGTFDNSLHIKIRSHAILNEIRQALSVYPEISPTVYTPHITLGFYDDNYLMVDILDKIQAFQISPKTFLVDKLIFGTYIPTQPQGVLSCCYEFLLKGLKTAT